MKKLLVLFTLLFTFSGAAFADADNTIIATGNTQVSMNNVVATPQPTKTTINQCFDTISMNSEQLFYLTMTALNNMNFKVKEVQSKTGSILFQAYSREFLITIADRGSNQTFIKILPTDSNYSFSPAMLQNIFGFLKANASVNPIIL